MRRQGKRCPSVKKGVLSQLTAEKRVEARIGKFRDAVVSLDKSIVKLQRTEPL